MKKIREDLEEFLIEKSENIKKKNNQVIEHDFIRDWVENIFENKIGDKLSEDEVLMLNSECQKRFEKFVPPGFEDKSKEKKEGAQFGYDGNLYNEAFGDFYIWKELLGKARNLKSNTVFFITNDEKKDMVHKVGHIKMGAHASLREEFFQETFAKNFEILSTYEFITGVNNAYRLDIDQEDIKINHFDLFIKNQKKMLDRMLGLKAYQNQLDQQNKLLRAANPLVLQNSFLETTKKINRLCGMNLEIEEDFD